MRFLIISQQLHAQEGSAYSLVIDISREMLSSAKKYCRDKDEEQGNDVSWYAF
jgi:hypothetical protein